VYFFSIAAFSSSNDKNFELLDVEEKVVCLGVEVQRTIVHGHQLTQGWRAFEIKKVLDSSAKAWESFPGEIEKGGFIAWPVEHIRPLIFGRDSEPKKKKTGKEARGLIDQLHPDFGKGSPSALAKQSRHSRKRKI